MPLRLTQSSPAMQVPLLDLKAQYRELKGEIQAAIEKVCASQHFILGPQVRELETRVAGYSQCRYGIGVSSGTDALLVALMALDIAQGDEVITSPFTFFATAGTIARVGARPLFCDIEPDSFNLSPAALQRLIEEGCELRGREWVNRRTGGRIKALMPVHLYGQLCDMEELMAAARRLGLDVIEDAAQAIGAEDGAGKRAGSFGHIGCLSFFPTKNLGASATPACASQTIRRSPSGSRSCACTAASRSTTTPSSAETFVSMNCRPPC